MKFRIEVQDTGVAIKKENLNKLFMDFSRLDEHSQMNSQGTGLGLSICKRMIEKMGGQVKVDSVEDVGTTFTVELSTKAKNRSVERSKIVDQYKRQDQKIVHLKKRKIARTIEEIHADRSIVNLDSPSEINTPKFQPSSKKKVAQESIPDLNSDVGHVQINWNESSHKNKDPTHQTINNSEEDSIAEFNK